MESAEVGGDTSRIKTKPGHSAGSDTSCSAVDQHKLVSNSTMERYFSVMSRQIFASMGSLLCAVSGGMVIGFSAILFPQIEANKDFDFSSEEKSWIASMAALPMAPACIVVGIIMETAGRKVANIVVSVPFTFGWILIYYANGLLLFLLGRFLQGVSLGMSGPLNSIYVGETTGPLQRGYLLGGLSLGYTLGVLMTHLMGTYLSWRTTAIICGAINVFSIIIFLISPESPTYLVGKKKIESAREAFCWFRGFDEEASSEFSMMVLNSKIESESEKKDILKSTRRPEFFKPLFILIGMFFVLQFVGVNAVIFYTARLMKDTVGGLFSEQDAMILIDSIRFLITLVACFSIKHINRRPLFILSGYGTGVCMILLSIFCFISDKFIIKHYSYFPMIFFVGYVCFSSLGLLPLPWCLIGEIFPPKLRGLGSGVASGLNFVFFFVVVKLAPLMFEVLSLEGSFLFYGLISILGTFLLSLILPETKNKTLQQIENEFAKSR